MMKRIMITLNDQGGGVMSWNYNEKAETLRAEIHGHQPIVVVKDEAANNLGIKSESRNDNG